MYFNVQFDVRAFWHGVLLNPHNAKVHHLTYDACLSSHSIIFGIRSSSLRNLQCYPLTVWSSNPECESLFYSIVKSENFVWSRSLETMLSNLLQFLLLVFLVLFLGQWKHYINWLKYNLIKHQYQSHTKTQIFTPCLIISYEISKKKNMTKSTYELSIYLPRSGLMENSSKPDWR